VAEHEFDIESLDLTEISPPDFARLIKDMPERQLAAIGTGPSRERIVDEILSRMATSFKPEVGGRLRAVIRWRILDTDQPEITFEMDIADQACRLTKGVAEPEPRLVLTMSTADFARLRQRDRHRALHDGPAQGSRRPRARRRPRKLLRHPRGLTCPLTSSSPTNSPSCATGRTASPPR